jgi:hypothetical protein
MAKGDVNPLSQSKKNHSAINRAKSMLTVIDQIKKELFIDSNGNVTCTIRGVARLAGVATQALSRHFKSVNKNGGKLLEMLTSYGFDPSTFAKTKVPAQAVSLILSYYAFEAGERCTAQAKSICYTFMAIGFQEWVKKEFNWQSPNKKDYSTFLLKAPRVWTKVFEDDIYDDLARLTGLTWDKKTHRKPCLFAKLTFELVYRYLPQEVYQTLKQTQEEHGGYIHKIHEFLSPDGLESLKFHLTLVANILSGCSNIYEAKRLINQSVTKEYQLSLFSK